MNRPAASWFGSLALHVGAVGSLSFVAIVVPVQIGFKRGQTSIELQASIAAAPPAYTEPPTKIEPTKQPQETKPPELAAVATDAERQPAKLPETKKSVEAARAEAEKMETAVATLERPPEMPPEEDVESEPPQRKFSEAKPRDVGTPTESLAQAASKADSGIDVDELPRPHALNRQPPYPRDAYVRRQQGTVVLHLHVTVVGTVADVRVVRSSGVSSLDQAAIEAARGWRYTPARRGGASVAMVFETHVNFTLRS